MVVYEVAIEVADAVGVEYRRWLAVHVDEILALPGFVAASCWTRRDPPPEVGSQALVVQYRLRDRAALEAYLVEHAPRLRAEGERRFGGRFRASRRVLEALDLNAG